MIQRNYKGFLQVGLIILVASLFAAGFLINKLRIESTDAADGCKTHTTQSSCNNSCSPAKGKDNKQFECKWVGGKCGEGAKECGSVLGKDIDTDDSFKIHPKPVKTGTPTPTPTASPTPTTTPTVTPVPKEEARLTICKYNDADGNGQVNNNEGTMGWIFNYDFNGKSHTAGSAWWHIWNRGCVTVKVPARQWVTVSEQGRDGWRQTGIYADGNWAGTGSYNYISRPDVTKTVWFLNFNSGAPTPTPTGVPNFCGGTCGSNSNCQPGLFCVINSGETSGFCRNPSCSSENSCVCPGQTTVPTFVPSVVKTPTTPPVLGATAPPRLPNTGSNDGVIVVGLVSLIGVGYFLFRKFRLV